jgi:transcriptional regulator with XRE-family HTH domain
VNGMAKPVQIHRSKQPRRPHYIEEWAEKRNLAQADLARELGADKSVVSRWFSGTSPSLDWQERLAALFHVEREALFRHPDEDWLARKLRRHTKEERERIIKMVEAAFPDPKTGTNDR